MEVPPGCRRRVGGYRRCGRVAAIGGCRFGIYGGTQERKNHAMLGMEQVEGEGVTSLTLIVADGLNLDTNFIPHI